VTEFFYTGTGEPIKAGIHGSILGLALLCFGYNAIAYCFRKEPHLVRNTIIYGALSALETVQLKKHLE
jgi:hypothetical protein